MHLPNKTDVKNCLKRFKLQKLERNTAVYLAVGKIKEINKFEAAESGLNLLMKNKIMHIEKYRCK